MSDVLAVLERIAAVSSTSAKVMIARSAIVESKDVATVITYALDPYRRYYLRQMPDAGPSRRSLKSWTIIIEHVLEPLARREITGHAARSRVHHYMGQMSGRDQEVLRRVLNKDLKCGLSVKLANTAFSGLVPTFEVQAAAGFDEAKLKLPSLAEPKYDGMRVIAVIDDESTGQVTYLSRGGRPVNTMGHVTDDLLRMFPDGAVVDGEAVLLGAQHEQTMSAVKRGTAKGDALPTFVAFDVLTRGEFADQRCQRPYRDRRDMLVAGSAHLRSGYVKLAPVRSVSSIEAARELFAEWRAKGHEGLVLKDPDGLYEFKRTRAWMKMKPSDTLDVKIVAALEGKGKHAGRLGALVFHHEGRECRVGTGFSDEDRRILWRQHKLGKPALVGSLMEVEFTEATAKGSTRHARFIRLRDYDGERD